ncbi:MAG: hypothetical protein AAB535_02395 [Patescibacteria group bacterium]|mgnify:FL=1
MDRNATVLNLKNLGKPFNGESLLKIISREVWEQDVLNDKKGILISLPTNHISNLTIDDVVVNLKGKESNKFELSFATSSK